MTSRERLLCAFDLGTPDRVPVAPFGFGHVDPDSRIGRELVRHTDFIHSIGGTGGFLGAAAETEVENLGNTTTRTVHTPKGDLRSVWQRTDITSAQVEFPCKGAEDIEKLLAVPYEPVTDVNAQAFNDWKDRIGDDGIVLMGFADPICTPATFFSPQDFSLLWADDREAFLRIIQVATERLCTQAEICCEAGIDAFRLLGGEYASTQLGPEAYRLTVTDPDRQICQVMHDHGAIVYYHQHGPTMDYLEMIADIGMDACDCFEAEPWGDFDLPEAKQRIGDRLCFVGNLDDMEVIEKRPRQEVCDMARTLIQQSQGEGFVLGGTASGTYTEPAARNFIAMAELSKEMSLSP